MELPLKGGLARHLPVTRRQGEQAGEAADDHAPAISSKLILAIALAISCIAHLAFLTPAVIFGGRPFNAPPADAVAVDIVSLDEVPQPADQPSPGGTPATTTEASPALPPAEPAALPPERALTLPAGAAASQAQAASPSALPPPPFEAPQQLQREPPQPPEPDESNATPMFAMPLTMPDGTVGGRSVDQPAAHQADVPDNVAAAFFDHLKSCQTRPAEMPQGVRVVVRVYLNPDGSLAAGLPANPEPLKVSMGGGELFMNAVAALRKCQPYTMLPPDRYPEWRTLDLTFTARNF
jgi:hypothetical protein